MLSQVLGHVLMLSFLSDLLNAIFCVCGTQPWLYVTTPVGARTLPGAAPTPSLMSWSVMGLDVMWLYLQFPGSCM